MQNDAAHQALAHVGKLGYLGAFIVGMFFVSTFTVAPSMVVLFFLADTLNPLYVAPIAGAGAVLGDFLIFRFFKDRVFDEIKPVFMNFGGSHLSRLFATPYFAWLAPVFGALIIASPLPDEIGVGLLGATRIKWWQFLILAFTLNSIGILVIITAATVL
jgi:hypothetical protein